MIQNAIHCGASLTNVPSEKASLACHNFQHKKSTTQGGYKMPRNKLLYFIFNIAIISDMGKLVSIFGGIKIL